MKLKANINNLEFHCVFQAQFENLYDKDLKCIISIGFRIQKHIDDSNIRTLTYFFKPVRHSRIF